MAEIILFSFWGYFSANICLYRGAPHTGPVQSMQYKDVVTTREMAEKCLFPGYWGQLGQKQAERQDITLSH